jgi:hypothetical protein
MEKPLMISERTWIPLGASILIFLAAAWLTSVQITGMTTKDEVSEIKLELKEDRKILRLELQEIRHELREMNKKK